jgi:hypothetical protein
MNESLMTDSNLTCPSVDETVMVDWPITVTVALGNVFCVLMEMLFKESRPMNDVEDVSMKMPPKLSTVTVPPAWPIDTAKPESPAVRANCVCPGGFALKYPGRTDFP